VLVDIKPGSDPNEINPFGKELIPVAILGSDVIDVLDVNPSTLAFPLNGAALAHGNGPHYSDVNGDGFTDLVSHFRTPETGIAMGDGEACLSGAIGGSPFTACDAIETMPGCGIGFELALLLLPLMWLHERRRHRMPKATGSLG